MNKDKLANSAGEITQLICSIHQFPQDEVFLSDDSEINSMNPMNPEYLYLKNKLATTIFETLITVYTLGHNDGFNEGVCK